MMTNSEARMWISVLAPTIKSGYNKWGSLLDLEFEDFEQEAFLKLAQVLKSDAFADSDDAVSYVKSAIYTHFLSLARTTLRKRRKHNAYCVFVRCYEAVAMPIDDFVLYDCELLNSEQMNVLVELMDGSTIAEICRKEGCTRRQAEAIRQQIMELYGA